MSVESARADVVATADEYAQETSAWDGGAGNRFPEAKRAHLHAALDRLVLEVQAAMPCISCGRADDFCEDDCECIHDLTYTCPSCTARRQLAEVPV